MAVNPNWARWAFASVATLMKQIAKEANIPALMEGLDERTTQFMEAATRVEIRMSGPFTKELSKDYYELGVDINLLFTSRYESQREPIRHHHRLSGSFTRRWTIRSR